MASAPTTDAGFVEAHQTMVISPNPSDTWDIWGDHPPTRWVGYGGDTSVMGDAYFPAPNQPQGALLVYLNNELLHVFSPKETSYTVRQVGQVTLGPNDGGAEEYPFSDNQGWINVTCIILP
jgi:hypothetical protein